MYFILQIDLSKLYRGIEKVFLIRMVLNKLNANIDIAKKMIKVESLFIFAPFLRYF